MTDASNATPFARRAIPVVALLTGGVALWRSLDSSAANSLRLTLRRPARATSAGGSSHTSASTVPSGNQGGGPPTTTTIASTVCAHPARVDGPVIETSWGPVQVRAQLGEGDHVCSADAIQTPSDHNQSVFINEQAVPWIDDEVKTQGVNFDAIGGATITSEGYRMSLQSLLDARSHGSTPST